MKATLITAVIFVLLMLAGCNGGTNPDGIHPGGGYSERPDAHPLVDHSKLPEPLVYERE